MSAPHIILDNLPSLCQKLSDFVEVWRSYNKNNFACFLLRHGVQKVINTVNHRSKVKWINHRPSIVFCSSCDISVSACSSLPSDNFCRLSDGR